MSRPRHTNKRPLAIVGAIALITLAAHAGQPSRQLQNELNATAPNQPVQAILRLQPAILKFPAKTNRLQRLSSAYRQLTEHARRSQAPVLARLQKMHIPYRAFWISNDILVTASKRQIQQMLDWPEIRQGFSNAPFKVSLPANESPPGQRLPQVINGIEWNVSMVNAPAVWALGYTGQGVVVGGQDTGYQWDHPALINAYRGWNGSTANHNYNWHDAIHTGGGICGANSPVPCDDDGHGTHTMGTIVGDDGLGNQVGVAPGARWIGCRNMDSGWGTPASYTECFQWFMAPTDLNDQNPDPARAPHIINNSWGCVPSEGCTDPDQLKTVVDNVVAAGIVVVVSAGNGGAACATVTTPAAIYDSALTVGSTTSSDSISGFSSRGPVTVDGSNRMKPDLSAPGSSVRSAQLGGGYSLKSGTSMASPNVAGVAALLLSTTPSLAGQPAAIKAILTGSAEAKTTTQNCGNLPGNQSPNNTYGWGRIDALAAVQSQLSDLIFADGFQ